ncbi:MAG: response regulator [Thermodesulfovibrionales bacterium]
MEEKGEEIRILCVDDEPNVLNALKRLFLDEDYTILTASSGQEGISLLEREQVQLVISDYRMPSMNGVEFLTEVYNRWPDSVRIVLSGYADTASIVSAINDGQVYKFIPKPWNDDELKVTIANSIERYFLFKKNRQLTEELQIRNLELQELNDSQQKLLREKGALLAMREKILKAHQNILDSIPVGIIGIDRSGMIVMCNVRWREVTGHSLDILGTNIGDMGIDQLVQMRHDVFETGHIVVELVVNNRLCRLSGNLLDPKTGQEGATFTIIPECKDL